MGRDPRGEQDVLEGPHAGDRGGDLREIDETKAFPFVLVDWRINDRLRLANPTQAGPAGGAGLELAWTLDDRWEIAGGGAWRTYRFRLDRNGPTPDGIGESRGVPLFLRTSYAVRATSVWISLPAWWSVVS